MPEQPPGLTAAIEAVIERPGPDTVDALVALVSGFRDWGVADQHWGTKFMLDTELAWLRGNPVDRRPLRVTHLRQRLAPAASRRPASRLVLVE